MRRIMLASLFIFFLAGCADVELSTQPPKQTAFIKQQQAIDAARDLARVARSEDGPDETEPTNV